MNSKNIFFFSFLIMLYMKKTSENLRKRINVKLTNNEDVLKNMLQKQIIYLVKCLIKICFQLTELKKN